MTSLRSTPTTEHKAPVNIFQKHVALPHEYGAWIFLLTPLSIGLFVAHNCNIGSGLIVIAALSAFLIRQPATIIIKVLSGRRPRRDLPVALVWLLIYGLIGIITFFGIIVSGYAYVLLLAIPGIPVFSWHLYLVSKKLERRQPGIELLASGVLALAAPAAYWVGTNSYSVLGWWLFMACWLQSAASIVYTYARLEQNGLTAIPTITQRLRHGWRAIIYSSFNIIFVSFGSYYKVFPALIILAFVVQWLETIYGMLVPAVGVKPTKIGLRQLIVSLLFTVLFIVLWLI
jgi:hypothetical protein